MVFAKTKWKSQHFYDGNEIAGITLFNNKVNWRIFLVRALSSTFRSGKSPLEKTVTVPDLERIPGLIPIVIHSGWDRPRNIKLSLLLETLVELQSCTSVLLHRAIRIDSNRRMKIAATDNGRYLCSRASTPLHYGKSGYCFDKTWI